MNDRSDAAKHTEQPAPADDNEAPTADDSTPVAPRPLDRDEAEADDFATRSVIMSNALPGGASPVAGAVTARNKDQLEPTIDEERAGADESDEPPA